MRYSSEQLIKNFEESTKSGKLLYNAKEVNYTSKVTDKEDYCMNVLAKHLIDNIDRLTNIKEVYRKGSYNMNHTGQHSNKKSRRTEEIYAINLFNGFDPNLGRFIDYQTPIKGTQSDNAGKIDLLLFNKDTLYLIELKVYDNKETLLRAVLEVYTYYKQINHKKLIDDFKSKIGNNLVQSINPSIMIFKGSRLEKQFQENKNKPLGDLINILAIKIFIVDENFTIKNIRPIN